MNQAINKYPELFYLRSIQFIRVSEKEFIRFKELFSKRDINLTNDFIEKHVREAGRNRRFKSVNPEKFNLYYNYKEREIYFPYYFQLIHKLLKSKEKEFPKELTKSTKQKKSKQLSFFTSSKPDVNENLNKITSSLIFSGQVQPFSYKTKLGSAFKISYLDKDYTTRISDFLIKSNLEDEHNLINEMSKLSSQEFRKLLITDYCKSIKKYLPIERKLVEEKDIEDVIWLLNDDDWITFLRLKYEFHEFHRRLKNIIYFFSHCSKNQEPWIIIKSSY